MMKTNRRNFIKQIGILGLATAATPSLLLGANKNEKKIHTEQTNDDKKITFLFQGDSITDGGRSNDQDWNHIMGQCFPYLIASRLWFDNRNRNLMFVNRGISGNRVKDLEARWQTDTIDIEPDVLTILIGVNDVIAVVEGWTPDSVEQFEASYTKILDQTRQNLPQTKIIMLEPFIMPIGWVSKKTEVWLDEIKKRRQVVEKLAHKYNATYIELQKPFEKVCENMPVEYWIWDGVHPMPAGHELIARLWIEEVAPIFGLKK